MPIITRKALIPVERILRASGTLVSITGDTNGHIMSYLNVPGGLMGPNDGLELDLTWDVTGAAGTFVPSCRVVAGTVAGTLAGGSAIFGGTVGAGLNIRTNFRWFNTNALNAQKAFSQAPTTSFTGTTSDKATSAIDTAAAFTLSINAALANAGDTLDLIYQSIKLIKGVP